MEFPKGARTVSATVLLKGAMWSFGLGLNLRSRFRRKTLTLGPEPCIRVWGTK